MTSQNFPAMPKDRARRASSSAQAVWDCPRRWSWWGRQEWMGTCPSKEWEVHGCRFTPFPSPEREAARRIKLLEEWQKTRGQ